MGGCIFDIRHFSVHDGPGIRSSIFFKGCPLRCAWCHNPESQQMAPEFFVTQKKLDGTVYQRKELVGKNYTIAEVMEHDIPQQPFYEESNGGITLTGGDPLIQPVFAIGLLKKAKEYELHTAVDTCGFATTEIIKADKEGKIVGKLISMNKYSSGLR
ncbi:MAG: 4Fe-4S cluster-binding domain-containing protein [Salinivirgaceae bacterium]|jgi:pyruvate formate lyase activating enzyme|nr:4Fe-4S cluster-binding domain-containing protein [Salinivirgaceae bacterium]